MDPHCKAFSTKEERICLFSQLHLREAVFSYVLGQLFVFQVTMSIFMSFISAILILGNTAEMYMYGIQYYVSLLGSLLCYLYTAAIIVPVFYSLKLTSIFVASIHVFFCFTKQAEKHSD